MAIVTCPDMDPLPRKERILGARPATWPRDLVARCPRSGCGDEERRERIDMHDRAPQEPKPEMGCLGARDPVGFSAGPLDGREAQPLGDRALTVVAGCEGH